MNPDFSYWLDFLSRVISLRLKNYLSTATGNIHQVTMPELPAFDGSSEFSAFIAENQLSSAEVITLLIGLAPHVSPFFFDQMIRREILSPGDFPEIGGVRGKNHRGFLPTGETVLFLLAESDLSLRPQYEKLFHEDHLFSKLSVLKLEDPEHGEPRFSGRLLISPEYLEYFLTGIMPHPKFTASFPAEFISTPLTREDLVLSPTTGRQIINLENWMVHEDTLMNRWNMKRWIKPGYRVLFHGPPGTGKTLTAMIIGKENRRDVFRIDLSMVVSKFIGETEKNLSQLFDRAKNKDWILFFDEADALFGKRTGIRDAHDKYANQEVAYLLQRIESHDGLIILASNFKSNIDDAFIRRFQSIIFFPPPTPAERLLLWKKTLPVREGLILPNEMELLQIARKYEITGAGVVNVVQFCALETIAAGGHEITAAQIRLGIEREYQKEGKVF